MQARLAFLLTGLLALGMGSQQARASTDAAQTASQKAGVTQDWVLDSGEASWYGPRHAGRRTSSGERFDPTKMTAAHPSLPLGTMVRVTDMATGRSVIVRVNDREPPHGVRCIDLSEGAATALGIHGRGVAEVQLTAVTARDVAAEPPVEVAEAPDDAVALDAPHRATAQHGRRHRHHAGR